MTFIHPARLKLYCEFHERNCFLYQPALLKGHITENIEEANYLLLPFQYELIVGDPVYSLNCYRVDAASYKALHEKARYYDELSVSNNKKLIVFLYDDSSAPLPFRNAIVFRTSWRRSDPTPDVYGMPAFVEALEQNVRKYILEKPVLPSVSFRGQAAPQVLPLKTKFRVGFNRLSKSLGIPKRVNQWYLSNYLLRRAAIRSLLHAKAKLTFDLELQSHNGAHNHPNKKAYLLSLQQHAYILCVAAWGNYSYRFYETLREGRIPVFVDSDCLLPCSDKIDWQKLMVWIGQSEASQTAGKVLQYHRQLAPVEFEQKQRELKALFLEYLTPDGFSNYILTFLQEKSIAD